LDKFLLARKIDYLLNVAMFFYLIIFFYSLIYNFSLFVMLFKGLLLVTGILAIVDIFQVPKCQKKFKERELCYAKGKSNSVSSIEFTD
jgi:hypothetical protein